MGLDCRDYLAVKEYEFLLNWFINAHRVFLHEQSASSAELEQHEDSMFSADGYTAYDYFALHTVAQAPVVFMQQFGKAVPPIVYTNLFHLAELELTARLQTSN